MKLVICLAVCVAAALATPQNYKDAQVVRNELDNLGIDGYKFAFETSDGQQRQEQGELRNLGSETEALAVRGSYSYVGSDGVTYKVDFVADENGFQPQGDHLPRTN